jgi:hypothetical protein
MATTAPLAFEQFKTRLTLTAKQRQALRDRRERIRGYLADDWSIDKVVFGGSHARGSKIRPVLGRQGDVDLYVVLNGKHRNYGGLFEPPPVRLLAQIKATLDRHLETPKVRADSPCVRITYEDMVVDVVPAFARFLSDAYTIPYYKGWMVATPQQQQRVYKELDDARGGRFKPLLRMIKHWKAVHPSVGLRSYHLETLAYEIFKRKQIGDDREALLTFFAEAQGAVQYHWNDPGGSGNHVTDYLTTPVANKAAKMFQLAAVRAEKAIDAPTWQREIAIWRSPLLLGIRFPAWTPS